MGWEQQHLILFQFSASVCLGCGLWPKFKAPSPGDALCSLGWSSELFLGSCSTKYVSWPGAYLLAVLSPWLFLQHYFLKNVFQVPHNLFIDELLEHAAFCNWEQSMYYFNICHFYCYFLALDGPASIWCVQILPDMIILKTHCSLVWWQMPLFSCWEEGSGQSVQVWGQPALCKETLSQNQKPPTKQTK